MSEYTVVPIEHAYDFVPLIKVVAAIAERIDLPPHFDDSATFDNEAFHAGFQEFYKSNNQKIEWQRKISLGAKYLNKQIHFTAEPSPEWLKFEERKGFHVRSAEAKEDGIELLTKLSSRGNELLRFCSEHVLAASVGYKTEAINNDLLSGCGFFDDPADNLSSVRIGFQLREIVKLLDSAGIDFCGSSLSEVLGGGERTKAANQGAAEASTLGAPLCMDDSSSSNGAGEPLFKEQSKSPVPCPVTTSDIAHAFAGLRWDEAGWKKPLGDVPNWLAACRVSRGRQGVCETTWNPVYIGAALVHRGHATARTLRSRFQTKPALKQWLESWKDYEATYFSEE